jgi:MHS family proline/betaine transporter-like MFS transporter
MSTLAATSTVSSLPIGRKKISAKTIVAISIGNALEWFDIVVYGFLALTIAKLFFPAGNDTVSLLLTLGTFGVSFFMRPLGSIVLGAYADRAGRKKALTLSIALMMIGTFLIAIAPTYATIGVAAPALLVTARLIQGFSAGGEFGSATAFLAEQDPAKRGLYSSWQFASQGLTTILASGFGVLLNSALDADQLASWGWRTPFFFGLLIGPVAIYIRRQLAETDEFRQSGEHRSPLRDTMASQKTRVLASLGLVILGTIAAYTTLFMPSFAVRQLGIAASYGFAATLLMGIIQLVFVPVFGALSDRIGRLPIMTAAAALILLGIVPLFILLTRSPGVGTLFAVQSCIALATAAYAGPMSAAMSELFPTSTRGTGLSISYSFGVTIFGGFAPFIIAWLIAQTGSNLSPSFYVAFGAVVSLLALFAARKLGLK